MLTRSAEIEGATLVESITVRHNTLQARLYRAVTPLGLTPLQLSILVYVFNHRVERPRLSHLCEAFQLRFPTLSEAVSTLCRKRYLRRQRSRVDGRASELLLTIKGVRAVERGVGILGAWFRSDWNEPQTVESESPQLPLPSLLGT